LRLEVSNFRDTCLENFKRSGRQTLKEKFDERVDLAAHDRTVSSASLAKSTDPLFRNFADPSGTARKRSVLIKKILDGGVAVLNFYVTQVAQGSDVLLNKQHVRATSRACARKVLLERLNVKLEVWDASHCVVLRGAT
jgi:hypothetical protein